MDLPHSLFQIYMPLSMEKSNAFATLPLEKFWEGRGGVKNHGTVLSEGIVKCGDDLTVGSLDVLQWICVTRKYMHSWVERVIGLFGLYYM